MDGTAPDGTAPDGPVDPHQAMRRAQDRRFEREGIPMVLALFDEGSEDRAIPPGDERDVLHQGTVYADIAGRWAHTLFPQVRDTDLSTSIVVLQAMSYAHLLPADPVETASTSTTTVTSGTPDPAGVRAAAGGSR